MPQCVCVGGCIFERGGYGVGLYTPAHPSAMITSALFCFVFFLTNIAVTKKIALRVQLISVCVKSS